MFYPNHEYDALRVVTRVGADDFLSTGKAVTQEGWKEVYRRQTEKRKKSKLFCLGLSGCSVCKKRGRGWG